MKAWLDRLREFLRHLDAAALVVWLPAIVCCLVMVPPRSRAADVAIRFGTSLMAFFIGMKAGLVLSPTEWRPRPELRVLEISTTDGGRYRKLGDGQWFAVSSGEVCTEHMQAWLEEQSVRLQTKPDREEQVH